MAKPTAWSALVCTETVAELHGLARELEVAALSAIGDRRAGLLRAVARLLRRYAMAGVVPRC